MDHTEQPLTTGEVAAIFGVTTTTVKRWADGGHLPHFRTPGGHFRFKRADIDAFKESTTRSADVA